MKRTLIVIWLVLTIGIYARLAWLELHWRGFVSEMETRYENILEHKDPCMGSLMRAGARNTMYHRRLLALGTASDDPIFVPAK